MPARKVCSVPSCIELSPCPTHQRKPWADTNTDRISGRRLQRRNRYVMLRDDGRCHICDQYGADEVDHVIPLAEGGTEDLTNLAPIHGPSTGLNCHTDKSAVEAQRGRNTPAATSRKPAS